tara:strand:+ start:470 stop:1333 length:864 start_codon:yes stop_codon:yes gene_type:complete
VCTRYAFGVELPEKLYFEGNQLAKDGLILDYRKSKAEAIAKYLQARKLFVQILNRYPTWQTESGLVQKKLEELDARLKPLLLTEGISPDSILGSPGKLQAKVAPSLPSAVPASPAKGMSLDEEIAALQALKAKGETKLPAGFGKSNPSTVAGSSPKIAKPSKPLSLSQTEQLARMQLEKEQAERSLQDEQQKRLNMEASYKARLRAALAARPKSLEPGEMAKQVSANQVLQKNYEFLKVQSKRGESDLLDALDELEKARKENEFLRAKFRELQTENQKLRRALLTPR